jgi:rhodanese-related sulfurtransferase
MVDEITLDELRRKIDSRERFVLVEALPPWAYRKQHLPGAINIPFNRVERHAPERIPDRNAEIIIYCGKFT